MSGQKRWRVDRLTALLIAAHVAMLLALLIGPFYIGSGPTPRTVPQTAAPSWHAPAAQSAPFPNVDAPSDRTHEKGVVWVNLPSHIYHYPGYRWFGTTKSGQYMQEADALAEGNRAALNERRPRWFDTPSVRD